MGEEFCFENTVQKRIRLLRAADNNREPVILEVRAADALDRAHWDRSFRRDHQLVVDEVLRDNIHMSTCLFRKKGISKNISTVS